MYIFVFLFGVLFLRVQMILAASLFDVKQFKQDWCRQRKASLDWRAIIEPCKRDMEYRNVTKSKLIP